MNGDGRVLVLLVIAPAERQVDSLLKTIIDLCNQLLWHAALEFFLELLLCGLSEEVWIEVLYEKLLLGHLGSKAEILVHAQFSDTFESNLDHG